MARSRNLKPGFFANEVLAECDPLARILFAGLWCFADREGRLEDRPDRLKAFILPYDGVKIERLLGQLAEREFILRYDVGGKKCIWITGFHAHQSPHHMEEPSRLPPPPGVENRFNHSPVTKAQRERIFERDGHKCVECESTRWLQIDHTIPVSKGGSSDDDNLRTLCKKCNEKKGNRDRLDNESSSNQSQTESANGTYRVGGNQESGIRNQSTGRFTPPTVAEVTAYCLERKNDIDAEAFVAHYQSKGWKVGKASMKDWKSAVVTWEKNRDQFGGGSNGKSRINPGNTHPSDTGAKRGEM